jgi:GNAT superfamily N-acetyltransferase
VHRRYPESAELHLIAVTPEQHGRGVGTELLEAVEDDLRTDGARLLHDWEEPTLILVKPL